jgi:6-phospho-beta-glucosidase
MKKITVLGGGSTYTPELMEGFILHCKEIDIGEIYLLDLEESKKFPVVVDLCKRMVEHSGVSFKLKYGYDAKQAISDADYIIQQYRPGLLDSRIKDEKIPLKYGLIGQETTGVGEFTSGLRAFPIVEKYIEMVKRYANQNAFVVNFTNPSGLIAEFVINTLGFENFAGLCNIPINTVQIIADHFDCSRNDVFLNYYGLNHMSWIDKIYIQGIDKTNEALSSFFNPQNLEPVSGLNDFGQELHMILNGYLKYYYFPQEAYQEELEAQKNKGTRGEVVKKIENDLIRKYSDKSLYIKPEELSKRGGAMYSTAAVELIRDLSNNDKRIHIVNVKNNGAIKNVNDDYVLEISSLVSENSIRSIYSGIADPINQGLIVTMKNFERLTIEAFTKKSKKIAKEALMIHPLGPRGENVQALLDELLYENSEYISF